MRILPKFALCLSFVFAGSMWFYVQHIVIAHQESKAAKTGAPRGNLSDLYPRWLGTRELLLHRRDPYSADVTREIQSGYYGRPLDPARAGDPKDQQAFAYPVYVVFLLAPTIHLHFRIVQLIFLWFLVAITVASVFLWLRVLRWRVSPTVMAILIVLTLGSFQVLQAIKLQQLTLLVAALIALSALLLTEGYLGTVGFVLGVATIKPQLVVLLSGSLILWCFGSWRVRRRFVLIHLGTIVGLCLAGEVILPGWIARFLQALVQYRQYTEGAPTVLDAIFPHSWGLIATVITVAALFLLIWRARRAEVSSMTFNFMLVSILAVTLIAVPKVAPYNHILLLPAVFFILQHWRSLWSECGILRMALVFCSAALFWPWVAAAVLTASRLYSSSVAIQRLWFLPLYTVLTIPLAVIVMLILGFKEFTSDVEMHGRLAITGRSI